MSSYKQEGRYSYNSFFNTRDFKDMYLQEYDIYEKFKIFDTLDFSEEKVIGYDLMKFLQSDSSEVHFLNVYNNRVITDKCPDSFNFKDGKISCKRYSLDISHKDKHYKVIRSFKDGDLILIDVNKKHGKILQSEGYSFNLGSLRPIEDGFDISIYNDFKVAVTENGVDFGKVRGVSLNDYMMEFYRKVAVKMTEKDVILMSDSYIGVIETLVKYINLDDSVSTRWVDFISYHFDGTNMQSNFIEVLCYLVGRYGSEYTIRSLSRKVELAGISKAKANLSRGIFLRKG